MLDKLHLTNSLKRGIPLLLLACLALLAGCSTSVVVKADIPAPLVEKLPIQGSMNYTETFKNYVYLESEKKRSSLKSLDFTEAQVGMFDQIFGGLINLVDDQSEKDLVIEPEILDFQYSAPGETKLKQYEIWIKYRLKLTDGDQKKLADWTIKGYGKTPTGLLTSASKAFNSATNVALRDVGAQLSTRFPRQRVIKAILARSDIEQDSSELSVASSPLGFEEAPDDSQQSEGDASESDTQEGAPDQPDAVPDQQDAAPEEQDSDAGSEPQSEVAEQQEVNDEA